MGIYSYAISQRKYNVKSVHMSFPLHKPTRQTSKPTKCLYKTLQSRVYHLNQPKPQKNLPNLTENQLKSIMKL